MYFLVQMILKELPTGFVALKCKLSELFLSKMILFCTWTHSFFVCFFVFLLSYGRTGWGCSEDFFKRKVCRKRHCTGGREKYILIDRFYCSSLFWILISIYIPTLHFTLALHTLCWSVYNKLRNFVIPLNRFITHGSGSAFVRKWPLTGRTLL